MLLCAVNYQAPSPITAPPVRGLSLPFPFWSSSHQLALRLPNASPARPEPAEGVTTQQTPAAGHCNSNRNRAETGLPLTLSKQTTAVLSNRNKKTPPRGSAQLVPEAKQRRMKACRRARAPKRALSRRRLTTPKSPLTAFSTPSPQLHSLLALPLCYSSCRTRVPPGEFRAPAPARLTRMREPSLPNPVHEVILCAF
jgi:hypothetical protein